MSPKKHIARREPPAKQDPPPNALNGAESRGHIFVEKPVWNAATGILSWHGDHVLCLANHAYTERELLENFERVEWAWLIRIQPETSPELQLIGDATQSRRHAVYHLNARQGKDASIYFFSVRPGCVGWCDASWLRCGENLIDRSTFTYFAPSDH
jgi:hypothetical protein